MLLALRHHYAKCTKNDFLCLVDSDDAGFFASGARLSKRVRLWRSLKKLSFRQRINTDTGETLRVPDHQLHCTREIATDCGRRASYAEPSTTAANGSGHNHILNSGSQPNLSCAGAAPDDARKGGRLGSGEAGEQKQDQSGRRLHSFSPPAASKVASFFTRKKKKRSEVRLAAVWRHRSYSSSYR